ERLDAALEQRVDEAVVEVETSRVDATAPLPQHAGPRDREAKRVETELLHQRDVLAGAGVEVARELPGRPASHLARRRGEAVPDALAASALVRGALDLVRGRGRPPAEVVGKSGSVGGHGVPLAQVVDGAVT